MAKYVPAPIATTLSNSAANTINNNLTAIADALEKTLSRDGTQPNQMTADLDLNHQDVINVANLDADLVSVEELYVEGKKITPLSEVAGLGDAAYKNTGTTAGTVAAGDDERILEVAFKGPSYSSREVAAEKDLGAYDQVEIRRWSTDSQLAKAVYAKRGNVEPSHDLKFQDAAGNWWEIAERRIDVDMVGGKPDNSSDNTPAFLRLAAGCLVLGATAVCGWRGEFGLYRLTSNTPINLRTVPVDFENCKIRVMHTGIGLILGNRSNWGEAPNQKVGKVYSDSPRIRGNAPVIRVMGSKNQYIRVDFCNYFQIYADLDSAAQVPFLSGSSAYSTYDLNHCSIVELATNLAPDTPGEQWINENTFNLKRVNEFYSGGTYPHNMNEFRLGTFEGVPATIRIEVGNSNRFRNVRFEGHDKTIYFGSGTFNNVIERAWRSSTRENPEDPVVMIGQIITDLGTNNRLTTVFEGLRHYDTVAYTDISEVYLNNEVGEMSSRTTDLQRIHAAAGQQPLLVSDFIPARRDDFYFWGLDAKDTDTVLYRPTIYFYDAQLRPVTPSTGWIDNIVFTSVSGNQLRPNTGQRSAFCYIGDDVLTNGVGFIRVGWLSSSGQQENHLARALWIRKATSQRSSLGLGQTFARAKKISSTVTSTPVRGFAPVGYVAIRPSDGVRWRATFAVDTTLVSGGGSGSNSIVVSDATSVAIGDIIGINLDDRTTHWTTVSSVTGTTIGLTLGLASASAVGMRVVFNRWAT